MKERPLRRKRIPSGRTTATNTSPSSRRSRHCPIQDWTLATPWCHPAKAPGINVPTSSAASMAARQYAGLRGTQPRRAATQSRAKGGMSDAPVWRRWPRLGLAEVDMGEPCGMRVQAPRSKFKAQSGRRRWNPEVEQEQTERPSLDILKVGRDSPYRFVNAWTDRA